MLILVTIPGLQKLQNYVCFQKEVDWKEHNLQISEEGENLRVLAGSRSYLMKNIQRDKFLKIYNRAWNKVRLNFNPIVFNGEMIDFDSSERLYLQQRIVLHWLYVYIVNNQRFKFLFWRMNYMEIRRFVLETAQKKYPAESEKATILAANTLNMSRHKFVGFVKSDEEWGKMW